MTYRFTFTSATARQAQGLPPAALDALVERVVALVEAPWDAEVMAPGSDPAYRETDFGAGLGLLGFHVDDARELITITGLLWAG